MELVYPTRVSLLDPGSRTENVTVGLTLVWVVVLSGLPSLLVSPSIFNGNSLVIGLTIDEANGYKRRIHRMADSPRRRRLRGQLEERTVVE